MLPTFLQGEKIFSSPLSVLFLRFPILSYLLSNTEVNWLTSSFVYWDN